MSIPEQFLDELLARSDITDVIGAYVPLKQKGNNFWGLCPFHTEKTPSFAVSRDKQIYHCFGCGKTGNIISFVQEVEHLTFPDTVRLLAKRVGLEVPNQAQDDASRKKYRRVIEANTAAARFYVRLRKSPLGAPVQDYIEQRRINAKFATRFGLGAAPNKWDFLIRALGKEGFSKQELIDAGLAVAGKSGSIYDKFRARLMLPVIDVRGEVVGFTSRILPGQEGAKYLNSPDTMAFKKSRLFYGLNFARRTKRPNLILVEGNLDVITLHQAGFDNVIATMGTSLTEEHIRLLPHYTKELVLCYDNDSAGKLSTDRVLGHLRHSTLSVRVLQLPNAHDEAGNPIKQDPDDFVKKYGAAAFETCLQKSAARNDYQLDMLLQKSDLSTDDGRLAFLQDAVALVGLLESPIERELYGNKAAQAAGLSGSAFAQEVNRWRDDRTRRQRRREIRLESTPSAAVQPPDQNLHYTDVRSARAEEGLLHLLLLDDAFFPQAQAQVQPEHFSSPLLAQAFRLLRDRYDRGLAVQLAALSGAFSPEEMNALSKILTQPFSLSNGGKALQDYIKIIRTQAAQREKAGSEDALLDLWAWQREKIREGQE